jgi:hypothetical protein
MTENKRHLPIHWLSLIVILHGMERLPYLRKHSSTVAISHDVFKDKRYLAIDWLGELLPMRPGRVALVYALGFELGR